MLGLEGGRDTTVRDIAGRVECKIIHTETCKKARTRLVSSGEDSARIR